MKGDNSYDKISSVYNALSGPFENRYRKEALELFNPRPGEELLEIGFGTGDNLILLANAVGSDGQITGIDSSVKMCRIAEKKVERHRFADRVTLHCRDALSFPYPISFFDGIFMSFTLETFTDSHISELLRYAGKALKPEGRLTVLSMAICEKRSLIYRMYLYSHERFPRFVDCRPLDLNGILDNAGFSIEKEKDLRIFGLPVKIITANHI